MTGIERQLQATIDADPDNPANYLVYSDWLLNRGDQLGEVIALQCALAAEPTLERRAELRAAEESIRRRGLSGGWAEFPELATEWRFGFVRVLDGRATQEVWRRVLSHPACRFVVEMCVDLDAAAVLSEGPPAASVRFLRLDGAEAVDLDELWPHVPNLTRFLLPRPTQARLGRVQLPHLTELGICDDLLAGDGWTALLTAEWPRLRRLAIHLPRGSRPVHVDYARVFGASSLATVLDFAIVCENMASRPRQSGPHAAVATLAVSPLARGLERLDLDGCSLDDGAGHILCARRTAFERLSFLSLRSNRFTGPMEEQLRGAYGSLLRILIGHGALHHMDCVAVVSSFEGKCVYCRRRSRTAISAMSSQATAEITAPVTSPGVW